MYVLLCLFIIEHSFVFHKSKLTRFYKGCLKNRIQFQHDLTRKLRRKHGKYFTLRKIRLSAIKLHNLSTN